MSRRLNNFTAAKYKHKGILPPTAVCGRRKNTNPGRRSGRERQAARKRRIQGSGYREYFGYCLSVGLGQSRTAISESVPRGNGAAHQSSLLQPGGLRGASQAPFKPDSVTLLEEGEGFRKTGEVKYTWFWSLEPEREEKRKRTWDSRFLESPTSCEGGQRFLCDP